MDMLYDTRPSGSDHGEGGGNCHVGLGGLLGNPFSVALLTIDTEFN